MGIPNAAEIMRLKSRARTEADMIASALEDAPLLDREGMGAEMYPFNDIASAESVQAVIPKIVRRRIPENPWNDAHRALMTTDQNGQGYASFNDVLREVAFMVGVDYAMRSLPAWWHHYESLPEDGKMLLGVMVADMADSASARAAKGGAR